MLIFSHYKILEQVYESANSLIYRCLRNDNNQKVILKVLKEDYPTPEELTRYRKEYNILKHLADIDGVINVYTLEKYQNTLVIGLEDFGGISLKELLTERQLSLAELLQIAIQITDILGQIHQQGIIHKDINPSNLILNPTTGVLKIIDFGIATQFSREMLLLKNPNVLEGTLAYMSPEQTGRMNRSLDYRSDFYTLGVTFYELLTQSLPFDISDAMALVHCLMAKKPPSPAEVNSDIPRAVSDIIMKLLEKTAEKRYQSAWGLKADLQTCEIAWRETGLIEPFTLAQEDMAAHFQVPQKLYGREQEIKSLLATFERVAHFSKAVSKTEIMLIAGYSGIGKSVLVKELYQSLTEKRGYLIAGKFDQFQRNIPYRAIKNAFEELVQQLLMESPAQLAQWKAQLLKVLGHSGQLIIDLIPEIEWIIGSQPLLPQLTPTASQNRFKLIFQNMIQVFCQPEHPLVIFLDDLQWIDSASLKLLEGILTNREIQSLLLIGAYRDNEVSPTHPLMITFEQLRKDNITFNEIHLKALSFQDINQLIADSLHQEKKLVAPLTDLVNRKTGGNPFFVNQFLHTLYEEKRLQFIPPQSRLFDEKGRAWQWDMDQIEALEITDNVVDLMIGKLKKLPKSAQHVLRLAACVGNHFDLNTLSVIYEKAAADTFQDLQPILREEFILPTSDFKLTGTDIHRSKLAIHHFRFLHDRVQQAAYTLIDEFQKKAVHLQIARLLLNHISQAHLEQQLFDIARHFSISLELIDNQVERTQIAKLYLMAGQKAKAANAYEAAIQYLRLGQACLVKNSWKMEYDLTLNLYVETLEAEYINNNPEEAKKLSNIILKEAKTLLDKIKVYQPQIPFYITQNQMQEAIDIGLEVLNKLDIALLDSSPQALVIAELDALPEMTDPNQLAALRILSSFYAPAIITQPALIPKIIFTMLHLCVKGGHSSLAAFAYVFYGVLLCGQGNIVLGYEFGKLALKILARFEAKEIKCQVDHLYNALVRHWKEEIGDTLNALRDNIQLALETGNMEFAGYSTLDYCSNLFLKGEALEKVRQVHQHYIDLLHKHKQEYSLYYAKVWGQFVLTLSDEKSVQSSLNGKWFNETQMITTLQKGNNFTPLFCIYLAKSMLCYWFKDYTGAVANAEEAIQYEASMATLMPIAQHPFYYSLALLGLYSTVTPSKQSTLLEKVSAHHQKIKGWASHIHNTFQHKSDLIEAEKARVLGEIVKAMDFYESAIVGARKNGFLHEEALAYELAAEFYLKRNMEKIAQTYLREAHYLYQQWGALAKVGDLEKRHSQFLVQKVSRQTVQKDDPSYLVTKMFSSSTQSFSDLLDLNSVLKASQTLSGEIVLSKLLETMMRIVIENAGAEKGFLLLLQNNNWLIEAQGQIDNQEVSVLQGMTVEENSEIVSANIIHYVARTQKQLVLADASEPKHFSPDAYILKNRPRSVLCTPLLNQGKLIGLLYLENNLTTNAFTEKSSEVLQVLSSQVAISIENAFLYRTLEQRVDERTAQLAQSNIQLAEANHEITLLNEQLKSENIRINAELDIARQLQKMLLPTDLELNQIEELEIAGFMEPAEQVGGDYYDVLYHDGRVLVGIGDVTGHGLESGVLAIMVQSGIRTLLANHETDANHFLSALNEMVYHNVIRMQADKSMTLALLFYQNGKLSLSGQHEKVIILRSSGRVEEIDTIDLGFPIGLEEEISHFIAQTQVRLESGDVVVLYSDGITEAENLAGHFYGFKRLCEVVQQNGQDSTAKIRQAVIDDLLQFIGKQKVFDDITLLILKQK